MTIMDITDILKKLIEGNKNVKFCNNYLFKLIDKLHVLLIIVKYELLVVERVDTMVSVNLILKQCNENNSKIVVIMNMCLYS